MPHLKIIFFILILFSASASRADWRAVFERAGFLGKYALGASYEWQQEHALIASIGQYEVSGVRYHQANLIYRYSRWNVAFKDKNWRPLQFGLFTMVSLDNDRYFYDSPSVYPQKNYYDPTLLRYGAELGSTFTFLSSRIGIGYHLRIFDTGITAAVNNSNKDLQYYISSGVSLEYVF